MGALTLDVGLAAKLKVAFERNGWNEEMIDAACEGDKLGQFRQVMLGHATINIQEHVIDCDIEPFIPWTGHDWTVDEHQKGGKLKWDPALVALHLCSGQNGGTYIEGYTVRNVLKSSGHTLLNANVLEYLLANQELIPPHWKYDRGGRERYIFFWGTVYRGPSRDLYVLSLCWEDGKWDWSFKRLDYDWRGNCPAAVRL